MKTRLSGFTLIELVVVIVIIGILAVTAAPRFINLSDEANSAVSTDVFASFSSGVSLYHATCLVREGDSTDPNDPFNIEGIRSSSSGSCYPVRADRGNGRRINAPRSCAWLLNNLVESDYLDDLPSYASSNNPSGGTRNRASVTNEHFQLAKENNVLIFIHQNGGWFSYCHFYAIEGDLSNAPYLLLNAIDGQVVTGTSDLSQGVTWNDELGKYTGTITTP